MAKKVRVKDIAARLGLSNTLVSLVLNNKGDKHGIKAETQEKVIAVATQMGFFERELIDDQHSSKEIHPGVIGMVVKSLNDPFIIEMSEHLRKAFSSIGYGFSIISWDSSDKRFSKFSSSIKKMYSGVVLTGDSADEEMIRYFKSSYFPFVVLEKTVGNLRLNAVKNDCASGAKKLSSHIARLGYERLAIIKSGITTPYVGENINCVKQSLMSNLENVNLYECELNPGISGSINEDELKSFLVQPVSSQLLIVSEASLVFPVLEGLTRLRVRVPHDIALVSLEDGYGFDLLSTPVTRLRRDIPGMASKIVSMLWAEIKNGGRSKYKRTVNITPEFIVSKSCGSL